MNPLIAVMIGGGIGSGLRYLVSQWLVRADSFPMGTLTVNLIGCFLMGIAATLFSHLADVSPTLRLAMVIGFLGGFTTFSSFGLDTIKLLDDGRFLLAVTYVLASNLIGILAVWVGMKSVRFMVNT
jgi:CrcB protein